MQEKIIIELEEGWYWRQLGSMSWFHEPAQGDRISRFVLMLGLQPPIVCVNSTARKGIGAGWTHTLLSMVLSSEIECSHWRMQEKEVEQDWNEYLSATLTPW